MGWGQTLMLGSRCSERDLAASMARIQLGPLWVQPGCVGVLALLSPPGCSGVCSPGLAGKNSLPDQVVAGHAVRCVRATRSQTPANRARHRGLDRRRTGPEIPVASVNRWRAGARFGNPPAIGAFSGLVGLLGIAVQVGTLMVPLCNRALVLFKR